MNTAKKRLAATLTTLAVLAVMFCSIASAKDAKSADAGGKSARAENEDSPGAFGAKDFFTILGALLGAIAFVWRIIDATNRFLYVELSVSQAGNFVIARTIVENKGVLAKAIGNSLLLVGPENESPIDTANALLSLPAVKRQIEFTNDLEDVDDLPSPLLGKAGRALIPVKFYCSENTNIADERIGYEVPIDVRQVPKGTPYAVRFYIFPKVHIFAQRRLHSSTEATFVLP